jgi:hypothetical protein
LPAWQAPDLKNLHGTCDVLGGLRGPSNPRPVGNGLIMGLEWPFCGGMFRLPVRMWRNSGALDEGILRCGRNRGGVVVGEKEEERRGRLSMMESCAPAAARAAAAATAAEVLSVGRLTAVEEEEAGEKSGGAAAD